MNLAEQLKTPEGYLLLSGPIESDNIVNGDGLRAVLWTQGCRQHCPGCQNPHTWCTETSCGILIKTEDVIEKLSQLKGQRGITFCGGEPMLQARELLKVAKWAHSVGWDVWSFTGLVYENIYTNDHPELKSLINELNVMIDGPFILSRRDIINYKYRGSSNQRILYLKDGKVVRTE